MKKLILIAGLVTVFLIVISTGISWASGVDNWQGIRVQDEPIEVSEIYPDEPDLSSTPVLMDIDGDGKRDLYAGNIKGKILFYQNIGTAEYPLWAAPIELKLADGETDVDVGAYSVPTFCDVNNNGRMDMFVGDDKGKVYHYEHTGSYDEEAPIWYDRRKIVDSGGAEIDIGKHAAPFLADINGDGKVDLVIGKDNGKIDYYKNTGTLNKPEWTDEDQLEDSGGNEIQIGDGVDDDDFVIPVLHNIDPSADDDLDLFIGAADGKIYYYENTGSETSPEWRRRSTNYAAINTGVNCAISFANFSGDSNYDMLVGALDGSVHYYEHSGGSFILANEKFAGGGLSAPAFNDNLDLFIGRNDGKIDFVKNTGTVANPSWSWAVRTTLELTTGIEIDVINNSVPTLFDYDEDTEIDLVVGQENGGLTYYRNSGTIGPTGAPLYEEGVVIQATIIERGYSTGPTEALDVGRFSAAAFYDVDGDSKPDLIVGCDNGKLEVYLNKGTRSAPDWVQDKNIEDFGLIAGRLGDEDTQEIDVGSNSRPVFLNIDGDDDEDLFIGEANGQVNYYRNTTSGWNDKGAYYDIELGDDIYVIPAFADLNNDSVADLIIGRKNGTLTYFEGDSDPPEVSITSHLNNTGVRSGRITICGTASDTNLLDKLEIMLTGMSVVDPQWEEIEVETDGTFSYEVDIPTDGTLITIKAQATDVAGNTSTTEVDIIYGYVHFIELPHYYHRGDNVHNLSGIAVVQDMLHLMRADGPPSVNELYSYGCAHKSPPNEAIDELDPKAIDALLDHFDSYTQGYNFGIYAMEADGFEEYLKEIVHWMSWPVLKNHSESPPPGIDPRDPAYASFFTEEPYAPTVLPLYADIEGYARWILANGFAASMGPFEGKTEPWKAAYDTNLDEPSFEVYGLFLTDPDIEGIGENEYTILADLVDLRPMPLEAIPGKYGDSEIPVIDNYGGKYVMVAEPPEEELEIKCTIAPANINESTLNLVKIAEYVNDENTGELEKHSVDPALTINLNSPEVSVTLSADGNPASLFESAAETDDAIRINWKEIIPAPVLLNEDSRAAIDGSEVREFHFVTRLDTGEEYILIPLNKSIQGKSLSYAAVIAHRNLGHCKKIAWVEEPIRYVQLTKKEAIEAVIKAYPEAEAKEPDARLVWEPGGMTLSPFYPYWEVTAGGKKYHVVEK